MAAVAAGIAVAVGASLLALDDPAGHLVSHLAFALPGLVLLVVAWKMWPSPVDDRYGRLTRAIIVGGLGVGGVAQLLEGFGALGYEGNRRVNGLARLHDVALPVSAIGLLALIFGIGLAVLIGLARRLGWIDSRWMRALVGVAVAGVVLFVLGSFLFGY